MKIRIGSAVIVGAAALVLAVGSHPTANAVTSKKADPKKMLVVTHTTGFRHSDSIAAAEKILPEMGKTSGVFTVEFCKNQEDVTKMLTPEYLDANHFDGVFFANTTGNLHIPDLNKFLDWIKAGHAFFGTHSAGDTYHPKDTDGNTGYVDMVGCEFRTHGRQADAECIVEDKTHPATKHLSDKYTVKDEIYHFVKNNRADVHVLLSLRTQPDDGVKDLAGVDKSKMPTDMMIAWCKAYGKGRVFYTALGHREDVWAAKAYQEHLLGGIKWGFRLERGSSRPQGATPPVK